MGYKYRKGVSEDHLKYLQNLESYHNERNTAIEGKLAQISGQSSIVLSLTSLFIPLFYDKLVGLNLSLKVGLLLLFLSGFILFILSIISSRRILNINKYKYATGSETTVSKDHKTKAEFVKEEIEDLMFSIDHNVALTNKKGGELIVANRLFTGGVIIISLLSIILIGNSLSIKPKKNIISIENQVDVTKIEDHLKTLNSKIDSLNRSLKKLE